MIATAAGDVDLGFEMVSAAFPQTVRERQSTDSGIRAWSEVRAELSDWIAGDHLLFVDEDGAVPVLVSIMQATQFALSKSWRRHLPCPGWWGSPGGGAFSIEQRDGDRLVVATFYPDLEVLVSRYRNGERSSAPIKIRRPIFAGE